MVLPARRAGSPLSFTWLKIHWRLWYEVTLSLKESRCCKTSGLLKAELAAITLERLIH